MNANITIREALELFFKQYNLGKEGGLYKNWAKLKIGSFYIPFPNTTERKRALLFHDIHHIVTGYKSNWQGEAAISAWEIASGCGNYRAAWLLDLGGLYIGLFLFPKITFRAFVRGRRSLNLYHNTYTHEQLLGMKVDELRNKLNLNEEIGASATGSEIMAFIKWSAISALVWAAPLLVICAVIIWWKLS